jgi:hypothetical protein
MIVRANATASEQAALTDYIGQAYQLSDIPKIGDILSPVAPVAAWSRAFSEWGRSNPKPVTAQLERRQMGIIVHLQRLDEELLWAIAYHHLYIYHTELLSLHARGQYIKIRGESKDMALFSRQLLAAKAEYLGEEYY